MQCPIHGTTATVPAAEHDDDFDVACPECRQAWAARGNLYELPPRDDSDELEPAPQD